MKFAPPRGRPRPVTYPTKVFLRVVGGACAGGVGESNFVAVGINALLQQPAKNAGGNFGVNNPRLRRLPVDHASAVWSLRLPVVTDAAVADEGVLVLSKIIGDSRLSDGHEFLARGPDEVVDFFGVVDDAVEIVIYFIGGIHIPRRPLIGLALHEGTRHLPAKSKHSIALPSFVKKGNFRRVSSRAGWQFDGEGVLSGPGIERWLKGFT